MRFSSIDTIRGFAILIMIFANSYPYLYPIDFCPKMLRLLFSTAAPIFIFLSGVSLRLAIENGKKNKSLILRAIQILFFAIIIDIFIWAISPFITMDVLYLISYSLLLTIFLRNLSDKINFIIAISIILISSINTSFYNFELIEIPIENLLSLDSLKLSFHHLFIDGWFPIFPWTSFTILGYLICKHRLSLLKYSKYILYTGLFIIFVFTTFYLLNFIKVNPIRDGYTEIFYPVSIPFMFYIFGVFAIIIYNFNVTLKNLSLISFLGKYSLPIYLIHTLLIKFYIPIFSQSFMNYNLLVFLFGILSLYITIFFYLYLINLLSLKIKKNRLLAFLFGL
jgi:uncharacterized membrane protein